MKRLHILILLLLTTMAISITGCASNAKQEEKTEPLAIYVTVYPLQFLVEAIGGETVDVQSIFPPGVDAHTYEPTSREMTQIATSDAFIYIGSSMEGFVASAADALADEAVQLIAMDDYKTLFMLNDTVTDVHDEHETEHHDHEADTHDEHEHENHEFDQHHTHLYNPHIWLDPLRMVEMAEIIYEHLIALHPTEKDLYEKNKTALIDLLRQLDASFTEMAATKQHKYIIVPHAAYDYWTERYGIEQIAISGISTTEEPSQKHLTEIIQKVENYDLDYVLYEQNTPNKLMDIIQEQTGVKVATIHNLAVLTDEDIANKEDYFSLMQRNIEVLDRVLP